MKIIVALGKQRNGSGWMTGDNCLIHETVCADDIPRTPEKLREIRNNAIRTVLEKLYDKKTAAGIHKDWQNFVKKDYNKYLISLDADKTADLEARTIMKNLKVCLKMSFDEYLRNIKMFFCLIKLVNQESERHYTLAEIADRLKETRQYLKTLVAEVPGAYQTEGGRKIWLVPESGIEFFKKRIANRKKTK